ncbi:hypothetical protein [Photobacterium rosenbergii]|uniref:Uncharacterized protein n=1 Tax=Photobacterium rosenbergii TaxID=294936 RepID=A0ABU3ZFI9_9GAMM|nr:hypothetical protein [Photobacterium rosenbergii]MDV5168871.1 hypothetical protein [Photobacterium rosenbergii]
MPKVKKKLTAAQKKLKRESKAERQRKYKWVMMNGKQVRVKREPTIEGMSVDEFIQRNANDHFFIKMKCGNTFRMMMNVCLLRPKSANKAIKVMRYTRQFWCRVQCALLFQWAHLNAALPALN